MVRGHPRSDVNASCVLLFLALLPRSQDLTDLSIRGNAIRRLGAHILEPSCIPCLRSDAPLPLSHSREPAALGCLATGDQVYHPRRCSGGANFLHFCFDFSEATAETRACRLNFYGPRRVPPGVRTIAS